MNDQRHYIKKIEKRASDVVRLELTDKNGESTFNFKPGQYVMISYRDEAGKLTDKHAFSIASAPGKTDGFVLGIKILGVFTQGIEKMREGDEIFVSGPFGGFVFDEKKHGDAVLIAGGIGITPMLSILEHSVRAGLPNKMSLLYSNKTVDGTAFVGEIKRWEDDNKNINTLFAITDEKIPGAIEGVINERIGKDVLQRSIGDNSDKTFFICGPLGFMNGIKESLLDLGIKKQQIVMEEFVMIPSSGVLARAKGISYAIGFSAVLIMLPFYAIYGANKGEVQKAEESTPVAVEHSSTLSMIGKKIYGSIKSGEGEIQKMIKDVQPVIGKRKEATLAAVAKVFTATKKTEAPIKTPTSTSALQVPTPTTSASVVAAESNAVNATNPATVLSTPQAPAPITSASGVAVTAPAVNQATVSTPASTQAPTPITSASGVVSTAPAAVQPTTSTPAPVQAPTPVTSASGTVTTAPSTTVQTPSTSTTNTQSTRRSRTRESRDDD